MVTLSALFAITLAMLIIWRSSDGFEVASGYLGRNLTDGVRGATINAVGSSIPELFTTLFSLMLLMFAQLIILVPNVCWMDRRACRNQKSF